MFDILPKTEFWGGGALEQSGSVTEGFMTLRNCPSDIRLREGYGERHLPIFTKWRGFEQ